MGYPTSRKAMIWKVGVCMFVTGCKNTKHGINGTYNCSKKVKTYAALNTQLGIVILKILD